MIDHDQLFKELLKTFFTEFLELFFPEMRAYLDESSLEFLDKQYYTDLVTGERREADIIAKARFRDRQACFITAIENQGDAHKKPNFEQRFFFYFSHFHQEHRLPVYPIAVFYGSRPKKPIADFYRVEFPDRRVLDFRFPVVQLNRLKWRDFVRNDNPIAIALMSRMAIAKADRPFVKLQCLRLLVGAKLNPAKAHLVFGFVDLSLNLSEQEEKIFQQEFAKIEPRRRKKTMELMTSYERKGFAIGKQEGLKLGKQEGLKLGKQEGLKLGEERGMQKEAVALISRLLIRRFGTISARLQKRLEKLSLMQLEALGEALLGFSNLRDLTAWLKQNPS